VTSSPVAGGADRNNDNPRRPAVDFARVRLILFDLDGTLVDSVPDLAWCAGRMMQELGLQAPTEDAARRWVGNGVERFVKRVLSGEMEAEPDAELFARGLELFQQFYARHVSDRSVLYPGVVEALERLAAMEIHLACVTNKPEPFTSDLIVAMKLDPYFELVVAGNTTARKKPDPMPLHYAADHFGLGYSTCLMVGDSSNDVAAARAAGFAVICVPYGYNHGADIRDADPDLVVDDLRQLAELFT